jgi:hypothetical protein
MRLHQSIRRSHLLPVAAVAVATIMLCGAGLVRMEAQDARPRTLHGTAFQRPKTHVDEGTEANAADYYKTKVSAQIELLTPETIVGSDIKQLLEYMGYTNITSSDLHRLGSKELMAKASDGDILASRFFAPKVTDVVEKPAAPPPGGYGWRKLVRLKARPKSKAAQKHIDGMYLLQNTFAPTEKDDPFDAARFVSNVNQVILVRGDQSSPTSHAAYFLLYGRLVAVGADGRPVVNSGGQFTDDGKLINNLAATFDESDRDPETNSPPRNYFTPDACLDCHGKNSAKGKANLLDTDHWFDRVQPSYGVAEGSSPWYKEEDFTALAASTFGVLYDGGKDPAKPEFAEAFDVIRRLNQEIKAQNELAGGSGPANFQLRAAEKWLALHASSSAHVPPFARGFGVQTWDASNQTHRKLLYYLNRYCYRCHSSVRYNVFDLSAVRARAGSIRGRVLELEDASFWMPQDRIFPGLKNVLGEAQAEGQLKEFLDLLATLNTP